MDLRNLIVYMGREEYESMIDLFLIFLTFGFALVWYNVGVE